MSSQKPSFQKSLEENILKKGKCTGCAACIAVCPFKCLEYIKETPALINKCEACGNCAKACPQLDTSQPKTEKIVFGRTRRQDESFGVHRRLAEAQTTDQKIAKAAQDGGAVTTMLITALENGLIDGAIVSAVSKQKPFLPVPKLATTTREILAAAGTRYTYSPNLLALNDAAKRKIVDLAFVGTPCQIQAIRKLQHSSLSKLVSPVKFLIGLMCTECFTYEGLMEKHVRNNLGIKLANIEKINIKGKILVTHNSTVTTIPLAEAKRYTRKTCKYCEDFSATLADISAGGLGLEGKTLIVVRSEQGERLLSPAEKAGQLKTKPVQADNPALALLVKLSKKKSLLSAN